MQTRLHLNSNSAVCAKNLNQLGALNLRQLCLFPGKVGGLERQNGCGSAKKKKSKKKRNKKRNKKEKIGTKVR